MNKKEEFKEFVKDKPELIEYVRNNSMTWQKFYEIYDLYGDSESAWSSYRSFKPVNVDSISNIVKNIDVNTIQKHVETAKKALSLIEEMTTKTPSIGSTSKIIKSPRPINKFFED